MKNIYLLCLFLITKATVAQTVPTSISDSINRLVAGKNTKERCLFFLEIAENYSNSHLDYGHYYCKKALVEAEKSNDKALLSAAYNTLGNVHQYKADADSSLFFHKKALHFRTISKDTLGIADSYNNLGIAFDTKGDFENALKQYFKALKWFEKKQDKEKIAMTYVNIGIVYKTQKEYKKAHFYYKKANQIYRQLKSDFGITVTAGNLGAILINFQNYNKSLEYSFQAKKGYENLGYTRYVAYPLSNIAVVYDSLHRFEEANQYYIKSINLHEQFDNNYEIANICNAFSNCLIKQKRFEESIDYGQKALQQAKIANADFIRVCSLKNLAKAYGEMKNFEKAYEYSSLYNTGMDELFKAEKTKAIFELEAKYENEKKSKLLLQIENKMQQRNTLVTILSLLVLFIGVTSYLIYRQQKIKSKQKDQEYQLKSAIESIESQNKLQEQRIEISRDLHDNIGAQLTFIISSINNIKHAFDIKNVKLEDKLQNISNFTKSTIIELRDTIWAMNTQQVSIEDFKLRIYNFIEKAKLAVDAMAFDINIDSNLSNCLFSSVDGMNIYRVVQEAVHNSIKYAQATAITVDFKKENNEIIVEITDNGKGFDLDQVTLGNGIYNMKKRIKDVGGTILIHSTAETGTSVLIRFPYKNFEV